jgi:ABC-type transport system substrate-binding protein
MDDLLNQAYTLNETTRQDVFCQMATLLDQELPQILLFSTLNADAYSTRMENVITNVNSVVSWNSADWKVAK